MAADSIAKLAVIITGDASPLTAEMGRASRSVDSWSAGMQRMQRSGMGMENIDPLSQLTRGATAFGPAADSASRATLKLSTAMSALRGNIPALVTTFGPTAAPVLGMAVMARSAFTLADAADQLNMKLGALPLDTWAGQWARLKEEVWELTGIIGQPLAAAAREASSDVAGLIERFNEWIKPDHIKAAETAMASLAEATKKKAAADKLAADNAKKHAEAMKEAAKAAEKERDERSEWLRGEFSRADAIKDSVRTPGEELRRTFIELRSMFGAGFIDEETAMRAGMKARQAFDQASGPRREAQAASGVGAFDRNTMAGFSAVQGGLREIERLEKVQKDQLKEEQNQTAVQKEIRDILHGQTPIVLIGESP